MKKVMKKLWKRVPALLLSVVLLFSVFPLTPPAQAATPTQENAIVFKVVGSVDNEGVVKYQIVVDGVYDQTYQSFTITYPKELKLDENILKNLSSTWIVTNTDSTDPRSCTFIIRTGTRSANDLKSDLESIFFTLEKADVFPPDGATVAITASQAKTTFFMDEQGYAHYYEWVPFHLDDNGVPQHNGATAKEDYLSWWDAYNNAQGKSMQDPRFPDNPSRKLQGYLATITSQEEQLRLYSAIADWSGWLGGTRQVLSSGTKLQDTPNIPNSASGYYLYGTNQDKWYWADGPEAWTVYNTTTDGYQAGGPAYQYYPKDLASVPANGWSVYNKTTKTYTYCGPADDPGDLNLRTLRDDEEIVPDPNRGAAIEPLKFYNNNTYASASRHIVPGVYSNWNNPQEGTIHVYDENKLLAGTLPGSGAEPNGTNNEYCLQFAYPNGSTFKVTNDQGIKASTATAAAGYDFMGWFEKNTNYTGTPITKSETCIPEKTDNAYAEKTYVAVFQEKDDITITYERDNLNASDSNLGGTINSFAERLPPVTGKIEGSTASPAAGYEFVGWFVKSGEEYDPSAPVEPNLTCTPKQAGGVYQPVTYVAVFREQGNVTIRYSATAGGEISRTAEGIAPVLGEAVGSVATANPGFVLVGWYNATDKEFVSLLSDEAHFIPARAGGLNAAGSYVARFTESPDITVKYLATPGGTVSRGSESTAPVTGVLKGATAKATAGCDFAGWYSNGKLISQDETFVPAKTADNVYESGTYVAMFVEKIDVSSSYQVEHYAVGGDKPFSTETFSGIIKSKVTAVPKNYTGYTYQNGAAGEIKTGTVTADGSLILKLYYTTAAYEINYVVNGAVPNGAVSKLPAVSDAAYDSTQTVAAAPAFVGYTFSGWRTADCMVDDQGKFTMPAGNVTFYGAWIPDTASSVASYKVEYYLEGRTAPYETDILQGTVGTIVSAVEKDGYTGYSYDAGNASNVTSGTVTVDGNLYYALNKHDVKYEIVGNAPAGAPSVQNVLNVPYGTTQEVASSSSMTYAGYVFTIWGTKDCSVHNGEFTMPDTDVTFMGSWIPLGGSQQAVYRVEHYLNNQLYETEEFQGVAGNTAAAIPKTGYLGCTYDDANPSNVKSGTLSADAPLVLKLYYTSDQYTVKYYVGGVQQESTNARYGDPMYVTAEPTNPGFIFSGWHTADCAVNADGTFTMPAGDVTFYGSWITEGVLNASGYKIEHYLVNGQGAATLHETEVLKGLSETPATAIPKIGYEGYVYDKTYTGNVETGVINDSGTLVLKLYYFPGRYQVRYSMTGDVPPGVPGAPADKTADYGSPVKVEDVPFYAGYTFSGWQTADTAVADGVFSMPGHDVAFTGVWTKNPEMFTVTFVDWDGTPLKSEYVPYGWDSTAPEDPARSGYTFTGWDTPYTNVQESITVQAKYSENTKDGPSLASDKPSSNVPAGPSSDNPNGGPGSQAPLTGDSNHLLLWIVMALAPALGVLAWRKRTRNIS